MIQRLGEWWALRSPREHWLLGVLGVIAAAMVGWYGIVVPLGSWRQAAAERHNAVAIQHAEVKALAAALGDAASGPRPAASARDIVAESAAAAGLEFQSSEADADGGVVVSVSAVRPTFLFGWIAALERENGLVVTHFSAERNADETIAADIGFAARGA